MSLRFDTRTILNFTNISKLHPSMKTGLLTLSAFGFGFCGTISAGAQTAAAPIASEIAGFSSLDIAGENQAGDPQLSLKAIGLIRHIEYQGKAETIRVKMVVDKQATWTEDQFNPPKATVATATYYLEVTSGPLRGAIFDIVKTDAAHKRLTLAQPVPPSIGPTPTFQIRQHWTLAKVFGAAQDITLQAGDASTADLVSIFNGKRYDQYYMSNGSAGTGWRRVGGGTVDESGHKIYPDDGMAITRRAGSAASVLVKGVVKTDRAVIPLQHGFNLVANLYQVPMTLANSHLYTTLPGTGLRAGATASRADNVQIFNGIGYDTYYYQTSGLNGSGWRSAADPHTDVSGTVIPVGSAFVVQRRGAVGFNWVTAPAVP